MFAGIVDPGTIAIVREIVTPTVGAADCGSASAVNCDTAVFSGPRGNYTITNVAAAAGNLAFVQVTDNAGTDGVDVVRNVERLKFTDTTVAIGVPEAPTILLATAGPGSLRATVNFVRSVNTPLQPITRFVVRVTDVTANVVRTIPGVGQNASSFLVGSGTPALTNPPLLLNHVYKFAVAAVNAAGTSAFSADSNQITAVGTPAPVVVNQNPANGAVNIAVGANVTASFNVAVQNASISTGTNTAANPNGGSQNVRLFVGNPVNNVRVPVTVTQTGNQNVTINPTANLAPSTLYTVVITGGTCGATAATSTGIRVQTATPFSCAALATTSWSFTTEIANPAPTVIATNPAANATNVTRKAATITATFSERVVGLNTTTVTIARTGGGVLVATVTPTGGTAATGFTGVIITPAANLRANTSFTVTLRGGATAIRDLTGKPLVTKTWSFTTGA